MHNEVIAWPFSQTVTEKSILEKWMYGRELVFSDSIKFTHLNVCVWNGQLFSVWKKVAFRESAYFSQVMLISIVFLV